jgi:uncharacterized protein YpiB (UPF0302 family)
MTKVELSLPDQLARELSDAGLLVPAVLERMLREQLREAKLKRLDEALDLAERNPPPPLTSEEIQAEIDAYRAGKRRADRS